MPHKYLDEDKYTIGFNQEELDESFREEKFYDFVKENVEVDPANFSLSFSDLYFYIEQKRTRYKLWVVPKIWFDEKGYLWDRFVFPYLESFIGNFREVSPGYFEVSADEYDTLEHAKGHLVYLGMKYNDKIIMED